MYILSISPTTTFEIGVVMIIPTLQKLRLRQESKPGESGKQQSEELSHSYPGRMCIAKKFMAAPWKPAITW